MTSPELNGRKVNDYSTNSTNYSSPYAAKKVKE